MAGILPETAQIVARLLSPLAPHLAEELWHSAGGKKFVIDQSWPTYDPAMLVSDSMTVVIQINGKLRGQVELPSDASKEDVLKAARANENAVKFLAGATPKKEIYVPGKLVNFVV